MTGRTFMRSVANGRTDILQILLDLLAETGADYCVVGGLAVNAYAEPVVSLDLDLVVIADGWERLRRAAVARGLHEELFQHRVNFSMEGSDLRIQLQTDPRYQTFLPRAIEREVLGYRMRVASLEDVLEGKIWAYSDERRRKSKRQKDLADIMRLVEAHPALKAKLPPALANVVD